MSIPLIPVLPNVFDFDGVITLGLRPRPMDIVITGRGTDEMEFVYDFLLNLSPKEPAPRVYLNPITKAMGRTREDSGRHKANTIRTLITIENKEYGVMFEDDDVQYEIIAEELDSLEGRGFKVPKLCKIDSYWTHK